MIAKIGKYLLCCFFLMVGCATTSNEMEINNSYEKESIEIEFPKHKKVRSLTEKEQKLIRRNLDIFYDGPKKQAWKNARKEILEYGSVGIEILCMFSLKFFYGGREVDPLESSDAAEYWQDAVNELVLLDKDAVPYIIWGMNHSKIGSMGRMLCSQALTQIGKPAVPMLIRNLRKGTNAFQRSVLDTLSEIHDPICIEPIAKYYFSLAKNIHPDDNFEFALRYSSIKALSSFRSKETIEAFLVALEDPDDSIVKLVIESSINYPDSTILPVLKKAMPITQKKFPGYSPKIKRQIQYFQL